MEIIQEKQSGIVLVTMEGRMEARLTAEFEQMIEEVINDDRRLLLFDLSAMDYLKSSVLRVILNAVKEINRKSGKVVLCCLNGFVKEVFEFNSSKDTFALADSVESGIQTLQRALNAA
jgi:anti-anti-sigma factor